MDMIELSIRRRINLLNWVLPIALALFFPLYRLGPDRWLKPIGPFAEHDSLEILFYATVVPILVFLALRQVRYWLEGLENGNSQTSSLTNRLARITSTSVEAIVGLNSQGSIDSWNAGAERLFGFDAKTAKGHPFSDLLGGGPAADVESHWLYDEVKRAGYIRGHETICLTAEKSRLGVELTATQLRNGNGDPAGMALVIRDITRRKRREEETQRLNTLLNQQAVERHRELAIKVHELKRANAELQKLDQTRSEFVSLVSHQIRAPLTNMGGAVQRMQADCVVTSPTCRRMFVIFEQQVNRLDRLVQDVLSATRLEAGKALLHMEPISTMAVVRQTAGEIRTRLRDRPIELDDKPGLPLVYADRDRVTEVLSNLLDNADKYSPPGKPIAIQVRADQTEVTVVVRDNGPGIASEDLGRVFDKFYRADSSDAQVVYGYGLGLYVCRQLMTAQGGRIWAENHPEGGAIFSIALPVWRENNG